MLFASCAASLLLTNVSSAYSSMLRRCPMLTPYTQIMLRKGMLDASVVKLFILLYGVSHLHHLSVRLQLSKLSLASRDHQLTTLASIAGLRQEMHYG